MAAAMTMSMRGSVASGVRWGALNQAVQQVTRLAVQIVLTRLLAPQAFGLLALAFVVINFGSVLTGIGFSQALIQRRELNKQLVDAIFVGSGLLGLALTLLIALTAAPLSSLLGDARLTPVLRLLGIIFLFQGIEGVPNSMLRRQMMFRLYVLSSTIAVVAGGAVGIISGLAGAGVWALVGFALTESVVATTLAWIFGMSAGVWRAGFTWDLRPLREVLGYSSAVTGNRVLFYGSRNVDNLIVGRVLGTVALGFYGLAYRLMLYPIQRAADVIGSVTLSAFALMQDDAARLASAYLRAVRYLAVVIVPLTLLVAATAPHLVPVLFGDRWVAAVHPLRILALSGPALALMRLNGSVWEATGRASLSFWYSVIALALLVPGFLVGVHWGVNGVAGAYTVTIYLGMVPAQVSLARTSGIPLRRQLSSPLPILVAGTLMAAVAVVVEAHMPSGLGHLGRLVAMTASGLVVYLGVLWTVDRHLVRDALQMLWTRA